MAEKDKNIESYEEYIFSWCTGNAGVVGDNTKQRQRASECGAGRGRPTKAKKNYSAKRFDYFANSLNFSANTISLVDGTVNYFANMLDLFAKRLNYSAKPLV